MLLKNLIQEKLDGAKLFITGGTGFFGKNILSYLQKNNIQPAKVTILSRDSTRFRTSYPELANQSYLEYRDQDILNLKLVPTNYDYIIHAATSVGDKVESINLIDEIVLGSKNLLQFAKLSNAKALLNISSGAVYGRVGNTITVAEDYLGTPTIADKSSSYGLGKLIAEHYSYLFADSTMKVTSLRCFCFSGPYLNSQVFAIGDFITKALNNEDIIVNSGCRVYRSYLHTNDLVEWLLYILINSASRDSNYAVYNLGSDEAISIPNLAQLVKQVLDSKSLITYANLSNTEISYYVPDISKIKQLGPKTNFTLEQIILDTANFYTKFI